MVPQGALSTLAAILRLGFISYAYKRDYSSAGNKVRQDTRVLTKHHDCIELQRTRPLTHKNSTRQELHQRYGAQSRPAWASWLLVCHLADL